MKPLDLNVSIQNSYEAARVESVRLEKPHVVSQLGLEDAQREQLARDQSVVAPESRPYSEDLFAADEYEHSDYTEKRGRGQQKKQKTKKKTVEPEAEAETAEKKTEEQGDGFSTYA